MKTCNQSTCENPTAFTYIWPGKDRVGICDEHLAKLRAVADAIGAPIHLRPVAVADLLEEDDE